MPLPLLRAAIAAATPMLCFVAAAFVFADDCATLLLRQPHTPPLPCYHANMPRQRA